jgi:murein L,D-transpeptidase YcbB/YkuD
LTVLCLVAAFALTACHDKTENPNRNLSLDVYALMDTSLYRLNSRKVREEIDLLVKADVDSLLPDYRTKSYYLNDSPFVWIDRKGVDHRADTLLQHLQGVKVMGFNPRRFHLPQIARDLERMRTLDFDTADNSINKVMARLEYYLTKAYLRYATGQQFGFVNPQSTFNRLDVHDSTGTQRSYKTLFALKVKLPGNTFFAKAFAKVKADSVGSFLREVEPTSPLYYQLRSLLAQGTVSKSTILANMERCRWRMDDYPQAHRKYVLVNIPSFHLLAVDGDQSLSMRVGCGTLENKTPLMASMIKRIDINPQWIMPMSIIRKSIAPRAGNRYYFNSHRYFIRDRQTGKKVDAALVSRQMLESGQYMVVQEGGLGNALGRMIFRFDNNLSIYLHDTSSPDFFALDDRGVSHGCVRVERPFDLAVFLMAEKEDEVIGKIDYSIHADVSPLGKKREDLTEEQQQVLDTLRRDRLIGNVKVNPQVPVYLLYYTLYPDVKGHLEQFRDVYGYDAVINRIFRNYL